MISGNHESRRASARTLAHEMTLVAAHSIGSASVLFLRVGLLKLHDLSFQFRDSGGQFSRLPVCILADLDLLRELDTFERIMKVLASTEQARAALEQCRSIIERIKAMGPLHTEGELSAELQAIIDLDLSWANVTQLADIRRKLSDLSAGLSLTARLKKGVESLRSDPVYADLNALLGDCRGNGLFLVPAGELEDWVPDITAGGPSKKKKAEWANHAANKLRDAPVRTDDVWAFVRRMAEFQRDKINQLGGYAL